MMAQDSDASSFKGNPFASELEIATKNAEQTIPPSETGSLNEITLQDDIPDMDLSDGGNADVEEEDTCVRKSQEEDQMDMDTVSYSGIESSVFKTSNRLMDDLQSDLLFLLDSNVDSFLRKGILKLPGIAYSKKLSSIKYNPYDFYLLNESHSFPVSIDYLKSAFNTNDKIKIIRGVLFSNQEPSLSRSKVYHVRILIKLKSYSNNASITKNEFHLVEKLSSQDEHDLKKRFDFREVGNNVLDQASYVCSLTKTVLRIEIMEPEFDQADLYDFEIGPINVRNAKAHQLAQDEVERSRSDDRNQEQSVPIPPTPAQCLHTLYKAIKGPLLLNEGEEQKTISVFNKALNLKINPNLLTKKMLFKLVDEELQPPSVTYSNNKENFVIRESYIRKLIEVILLGTKAYSSNQPNPFAEFRFSKSWNEVFDFLGDNSSINHHTFTTDLNFINISAYPFYSDDLIVRCYQKTTTYDPSNLPYYVDSLKEISQKRSTMKLNSFVNSLNLIGQKQIESAYRSLSIDPSLSEHVDDDMLLTMYKNEVIAHPLDGSLRTALEIIASQRSSEKLKRYIRYEPLLLSQAYELLDIDSSVDDDVISTAVMVKRSDNPEESELIARAFITIASERKSFELLDQIERDYPDINDHLSFKSACEYLGVDENANDSQIITIFQVGQGEIKQARNALRVIGEHKQSKLIKSYLKTGLIDHSSLPAEDWPVGLNNIGNTCYLNSLLQYYFSIKPLRENILDFKDSFNGEEVYKNRRIGGRLVGEEEVERSFQFTYQLRDLFHEQIHSKKRCVTPSKELAYLAFLPSVAAVEFEKNEVTTEIMIPNQNPGNLIDLSTSDGDDIVMVDNDDAKVGNPGTSETDSLNQSIPNGEVSSPADTLEKAPEAKMIPSKAAKISETEMETAYEIGRQQDVAECIGNVLAQIEAAMKPEGFDELDHEQRDLVKRLFYGRTVQRLTHVEDASIKRKKFDRFSNLFVNITDKPRNIYEAFDSNYRPEVVDIEGGPFKRVERIVELPMILQIQVQRVLFDKERLCAYKSIEPLPFPETLYMDKYLDTENPEIIRKRDEIYGWRDQISKLKNRKEKLLARNEHGISVRDSLKHSKDWLLENQLGKSDTIETLEKMVNRIDDELSAIFNEVSDLEYKIDHHFDNFQNHGYSIFAIFIHRGEANYGHYWIYIKDPQRNIYRKYNDDIVTEVTLSEVFNFEEGNTATPYFLAYVQNGMESKVEPLCRVLEKMSEAQSH